MNKVLFLLVFLISTSISFAQTNLTLQANLPFDDNLSDIWGYTDSTGREYAIVGLNNSTAIVDITDPTAPVIISDIPGPRSIWRDIKTYKDHAFVTTDNSGLGLHVLDLSNLPNPLDSTDHYFWSPFIPELDSMQLKVCHNLYITEETGIAYLAGCNLNSGGVFMVDVTNPDSLAYIDALDPRYSHDVYVRNDTVYSSDISAGFFSIMDATDKANAVLLATQNTPRNFTHNTWLSDNSQVLFTTDERGNASVGAYDISDLSDIKFLDEFKPAGSLNKGLIPHNVHVLNDFLVISFYKEGVIIVDAAKPDNLIEVGNYDTYPGEDFNGFSGTWGAYPFFPSGTVVASDIGNGLFVLSPEYVRACYLEGIVMDALSGLPLENVQVKILSDDPNVDNSVANGIYKTGQVTAGTFMVEFSKTGYLTKTVEATLVNGVLTTLDVALDRQELAFFSESTNCDSLVFDFFPNIEGYRIYDWTFEGGTPSSSTLINPAVKFDSAGIYTIKLNVSDDLGPVAASLEKQVVITNKPISNFSYETNELEVQFINLSSASDRYVWILGDGGINQEAAPKHTYNAPGTYQVELSAFNDCGAVNTIQEIRLSTTSLESLGILQQFAVTPNPFTETTAIQYELTNNQQSIQLVVTDLLGREILDYTLSNLKDYIEIGDQLEKGIYLAQLQSDTHSSKVLKIVKQ